MTFRITPHRSYELGQSNAQARYAHGAMLSQHISSGIRVNKPSDDPTAQRTILNQNSLISRFDAQLQVVSTTRMTLSEANDRLLDAQQLLVQAKEIGLQAHQIDEDSSRTVYVNQLNGIISQLEVLANAQSNREYLFSGTEFSTLPFTGVTHNAPTYQGSYSAGTVTVAGNATMKIHYSGQEVFQPVTQGGLVVFGNTGVTGGTGTSTGSQWTTLTLKHTESVYSGASGIQAGTSSPGGDTILGSTGTHTLTINDTSGDGSSGTISLNGGGTVAFTSADTNLKVIGSNGEFVYINTQSITAGFNGTVDITANGTLSIDGGQTEIPIDFSTNQVAINASSGNVQSFNTTGVNKVGSASVQPAATSDVFQAVIALRDTIVNAENLTNAEYNKAVDLRLQDLESASNHVMGIIGEQAVSLQSLDLTQSRLQGLKLNAQTTLSDAEGTDYFAAISKLQEQQTLLQFTMQSMVTISSVSLIDFL
ncbi:MAG TPA: flagellar hook-associated protein FlgL [Planctomicrobium sp.]|nr:flagellar hook-associated protein FlgL [Planctomicrobium sp.]